MQLPNPLKISKATIRPSKYGEYQIIYDDRAGFVAAEELDKPIMCPECRLSFIEPEAMGRHIESIHRPYQSGKGRVKSGGRMRPIRKRKCSIGCGRWLILSEWDGKWHEKLCDGVNRGS